MAIFVMVIGFIMLVLGTFLLGKDIKPMYFTLVVGTIGAAFTIIGLYGKFKQDENSGIKTSRIDTNTIATRDNTDILKQKNDSLIELVGDQQKRIDELSKQNADLALQLGEASLKLNSNITGGNSFCELVIQPMGEHIAEMTLLNNGDFPMYDVGIRIVDLEKLRKYGMNTMEDLSKSETIINVGVIQAHSAINLQPLNAEFTSDYHGFNIFFNARNGYINQNLNLSKVNNEWKLATRIRRQKEGTVLREHHDPGFPKALLDRIN